MDNPFKILDQRLSNIEKQLTTLTDSLQIVTTNNEEINKDVDTQFDIKELAIYLKCAKSTVHRYKENKVIPCYQAGRKVFFLKKEVDQAMSSTNLKRNK